MLSDLLESTQLDSAFCAGLIRVSPEIFESWLRGGHPIPKYATTELSAIFGVSEADLNTVYRNPKPAEPPAIWYKLRTERLGEADRELVGAIRKIGLYLNQLRKLQAHGEPDFGPLFQRVRDAVDKSAPPAIQGARGAAEFRRQDSAFSHGKTGVGEMLRQRLGHHGLLVVETPLKGSKVEGCSFNTTTGDGQIPCLFANTYQSTWFRRNGVLAHELCHAIFDLDSEPISIDYKDEAASEIWERRAQVFARDLLVPREVLEHYGSQFGLKWESLSERDLAALVASTHAEQRLVLDAALAAQLIDDDLRDKYSSFECTPILRNISEHALDTHEYIAKRGIKSPKWTAEFRKVRIANRLLTLPIGYVKEVLNASKSGLVTTTKAAEMLLLDRYTFSDRFPEYISVQPE